MGYKIVADSSCDIWKLNDADFATAALTISTEERTYTDDENMNVSDMLEYLAHYKKRSFTACPSTMAWMDAFGESEEIYVVTLTSGLSGTYNSAVTAKEHYLETHPDAKIFVVDSLSTSSEMLLILDKIYELKKKGMAFKEVCEQITKYSKTTRLFFAFQSLHNLAQNGRVPKLLAQGMKVLGISIIGTASTEGKIEPISKSRGKKKVINTLLGEMEKAGYQGGKVYVSHVRNPGLAEDFIKILRDKYPNAETKITPVRGLVAYYAEDGGIVIGCEVL